MSSFDAVAVLLSLIPVSGNVSGTGKVGGMNSEPFAFGLDTVVGMLRTT